MYQVYADNFKLYDSRLDKYPIFDARLDLELNKTGAFTFEIYPDHPNFDKLVRMKSIVTVWQDGELIFRGRALNEEEGFYNQKQVTCEGELAFLLDSIIRPYGSETAPWTGTPEQYMTKLIEEHNSQVDEWKQFKVGTVTVTDGDTSNTANQIQRSDSEYKTTWDLINEKLINSLGGYLWVRHEQDGNYIDYLEDFNVLSNQEIELGKNLLDLKTTVKGEEVMSAIIPLGKKPDGSEGRITIAEANNGVDYLYNQDAVDAYGWIFKTVIWDDVTDPKTLKTKAQAYLANAVKFPASIELTAADLAGIKNVNPFRLGRYIVVKSKVHRLSTFESDLEFLIKKLSIYLLQPANNTLTVGTTFKTLTESTTGSVATQAQIAERVDKVEQQIHIGGVTQTELQAKIIEVEERASSRINQSSTEILTQVAREYYLKEDANALVESINTQFTQNNEEFEFRFNEFSKNANDVQQGNDAQFSEISKYIRFIDGNIILGEDGNELTLKIENDRIAFLEAGAEVAYFSNRKLYVTDGEYLQSLKIGNYSFIPRTNGNLSFKKVT